MPHTIANTARRNKPTVFDVINRLREKKIIKNNLGKNFSEYIKSIVENEKSSQISEELSWSTYRGLREYNSIFEKIGFNVIDVCKQIYAKRKKPITVTDYGAGQGKFLVQLKGKLNDLEIPTKTTAVVLTDGDITKYRNQEKIDVIHKGFAEQYVPTEKQDIIVSVFGPLSYSPIKIREELLLAQIYSLNKGGILVSTYMAPKGQLKSTHHREEYEILDSEKTIEKYKGRITRSLNKRGFEVTFTPLDITNATNNLILIKRIK